MDTAQEGQGVGLILQDRTMEGPIFRVRIMQDHITSCIQDRAFTDIMVMAGLFIALEWSIITTGVAADITTGITPRIILMAALLSSILVDTGTSAIGKKAGIVMTGDGNMAPTKSATASGEA